MGSAENAADQLVRESEKQLRQIVDQSPIAMAMLDLDMRYLAANRRYLEHFHLAADVVGKSHYEVFPELPEHWKDNNLRALAGETLRDDGEVFRRADGSSQWVRWQIGPWCPQGEIGGMLIVSEEITDRVQAREALRASEASRADRRNLPDSAVYRYTYAPATGRAFSTSAPASKSSTG